MPGSLSSEYVVQYQRDGYLFPLDCLTPDEARYYRLRLEEFERAQGDTFGRLPDLVRSKSHLLFTWMDELVRHPKVLDAVESIIGPNILLYHLTSWLKEPHETSHVSWHQDGTYFGLEPAEQITAWIALTDSTPEMGCIKLLPGTHVIGQKPHDDTSVPGNLLSRGQTIRHRLDYDNFVLMPLKAGQISLHHTHLVHCSEPNRTDQRRIGIGVSYIPTHCRLVNEGARVTAALVRGRDDYGNFDLEPRPAGDFDPASRAAHTAAVERFFESNRLLAARRRTGNVGI
jgi:phytanoyl-CoA dioxygenase PhyH